MGKGSRANSTREGSRWRHEGYQLRTRKVNSSHGVRDNHQRSPRYNSLDMVTPKKRDSISSHSGRSYKSHRRAVVEGPSKLQKINETSKVTFLTAEEVIKRASSIEAPRSSYVGTPTDTDCLTSSQNSQIVGIASRQNPSASAKNATQVSCDGRQNSFINQHLPTQGSQSTENEEAPPGFSVKNSTPGEKPIPSGAENNFSKQVSAGGKGEVDSSLDFPGASSVSDPDHALKDVPPRNTEHGKGDSRYMDIKHEPSVAAAKPEKLEMPSVKRQGGGAYAVMPAQIKDPNRRTIVVNDPSGIKFKAGPSSDCADDRQRNLQTNLPNSLECPQNGPALKSIWKGKFEVLGKDSDVRCCEGILAHPSAKVSRRAYDFSRQMTEVLQFVIHPRRAFWPEIFQKDSPDRNDIALYFYPGNYGRSKRQYSFWLKLMERQDLVLRSHLGSIQLLVFPSKLLGADLQKLDGSYFMWGVFCSAEVTFEEGDRPSHIEA